MDTQDDKTQKINPFRMLRQKQQSIANEPNIQSQNTPPTLAQLETEIKFHLKQASQGIIEVGKRLIQAKSLVKHGEWQTWLENNFKLSYRTAKNFMDCAERFENMQSAANLNQSQMAEMLTLPSAEDTKKFIEQKAAEGTPVSDMTAKTLREEVKKWKTKKREATKAKNVDAQPEPQKQSSADEEKILQPDLQPTPAASTDSEFIEQESLAEEQSSTEAQNQDVQTLQTITQKANDLFPLNIIDSDEVTIRSAMSSVPHPLDILFRAINELVVIPDLKQKIYDYASEDPECFYSDVDNLLKVVDIIKEIYTRK